jgi:hypothetical protein
MGAILDTDLIKLRAKWTKWSIYAALILAVAFTAGAAVFNQVSNSLAIAIPLLLATQAFTLAAIDQLKSKVSEFEQLHDIVRQFGQYNARVYRNELDFYADLRASVAKARSSVWISYLRPFRHSSSRVELEKHLRGCFEWARADRNRVFRRIMSATTAGEIVAENGERFEDQQLRFTRESERARCNYLVRVVEWAPMHHTDSYSMTLVDDQELYFVISGRDDEFWAFYLNSKDLSSGGLRDRYNNLWRDAHSLLDHVEGRCDCERGAIPVQPGPPAAESIDLPAGLDAPATRDRTVGD